MSPTIFNNSTLKLFKMIIHTNAKKPCHQNYFDAMRWTSYLFPFALFLSEHHKYLYTYPFSVNLNVNHSYSLILN